MLRIQKFREELGQGQVECAVGAGVNPSLLNRMERHATLPGRDTLLKLSTYFTERLGRPVSINDLIEEIEQPVQAKP